MVVKRLSAEARAAPQPFELQGSRAGPFQTRLLTLPRPFDHRNGRKYSFVLEWNNLSCIFSSRKKNIPVACCSVIVLDSKDHSQRIMQNYVEARMGKKMAPMVVVCKDTTGTHCHTAMENADFVQKTTAVQCKFKSLPAVVLSVVWGIERMQPLDGEAPGRPKRASLQDLSSSSKLSKKKKKKITTCILHLLFLVLTLNVFHFQVIKVTQLFAVRVCALTH